MIYRIGRTCRTTFLESRKANILGRKHKQPFEKGWVVMKAFQSRNTMEQRVKREWVFYWEYNGQRAKGSGEVCP